MRWTRHLLALAVLGIAAAAAQAQATYKEAIDQGVAQMRAQKYEDASASFQKAADLAENPTQKSIALINAANAINRAPGQAAKAREAYQAVLDLEGNRDADYSSAKYSLAVLDYNDKQFEPALAAFEAVRQDPRVQPAHREAALLYIGHCHLNGTKQYDKARAAYEQLRQEAAAGSINQVNAQINVGQTYSREGNYAEAANQFMKVVDMEGATESHKYSALVNAGNMQRQLKQPAEARAIYEQAAKLQNLPPANGPTLQYYIGLTYQDEGNKDEARAVYQKVLDDPNAPQNLRDTVQKAMDRLK